MCSDMTSVFLFLTDFALDDDGSGSVHLPTFYSGEERWGVARALVYDSFPLLLAFFSHGLIFSKVTLPKCTK